MCLHNLSLPVLQQYGYNAFIALYVNDIDFNHLFYKELHGFGVCFNLGNLRIKCWNTGNIKLY